MFTGLVDDVGVIEHVARTTAGRRLRITCSYENLAEGESVAVNGACLTTVAHGPRWLEVAAVETTLGRTTIGDWREGRRVNLERAMRADGRFGGHLVLGTGARSAFAHVPTYALRDAPRWRVIDRRILGQDLMTVYAPGVE